MRKAYLLTLAFLCGVLCDDEWGENSVVVHLNAQTFPAFRSANEKALVMFYAPWCGHCKHAKPSYAEASTKLAEIMPLAALDCTVDSALCSEYGVEGYPTFLYFGSSDGKGEKYDGTRTTSAFINFARQKAGLPIEETVEAWEDNGEVQHLSAAKFQAFRAEHPQVFVMFYAPWCGHCKSLKPDYATASTKLKNVMPLAAVDCTQNNDLCQQYDVKGYPTLVYFGSSESKGERYEGDRTTEGLVSFCELKGEEGLLDRADSIDLNTAKIRILKRILADRGVQCVGCSSRDEFVSKVKESLHLPSLRKKLEKAREEGAAAAEGKPKKSVKEIMKERRLREARKVAEKGWEGGNGHVQHLIGDELPEFRQSHTTLLLMFYAPWCSHCNELKPHYVEVSDELANNGETQHVTVGAMDCTSNEIACKQYNVTNYPTLKFFTDAAATKQAPTISVRAPKAIIKAVRKQLGLKSSISSQPEVLWEPNGAVRHLDDDSFDSFRQEHPQIMAMFYAPWCGACKNFKPNFVEASTTLEDEIPLIAMDCTEYGDICDRYGVQSYPTLIFFENSNDQSGIKFPFGSGAASKFVSWVRDRIAGKEADEEVVEAAPEEDSGEPELWEENGEIVHLTQKTFPTFSEEHPSFFAMFYAPWCGHCKHMKPDYAKASIALKKVAPLVAVDCTKSGQLCQSNDVQGYPTLKWFSKEGGEKYTGGRTEQNIISFVKQKLRIHDEL